MKKAKMKTKPNGKRNGKAKQQRKAIKIDRGSTKAALEPRITEPEAKEEEQIVDASKPMRAETEQETWDRLQRFKADLEALKAKHNCRIHAYLLQPEWIGDIKGSLQVRATYGIVPDPIEVLDKTE